MFIYSLLFSNLSTVQEDDEEREETRRTELNSASFVSGGKRLKDSDDTIQSSHSSPSNQSHKRG